MSEASTMLFLAVLLLMFVIIMGYISKARIWNILSIAPATYIGISYMGSPAIIIMMIGIIIFQLYLTIK